MKKTLSIVLVLMMALAILPVAALAEDPTSGAVTDTITWSWDAENTTLTFTGTGAMIDYTSGNYTTSPWYAYSQLVTKIVVGEGITVTGKYAFNRHMNLVEAYLPSTLEVLSNATFYWDDKLAKCDLPEGIVEMGRNCLSLTALEYVTIPASVTKIQGWWSGDITDSYSTFRCLIACKAYSVAEGSNTFCAVDGVLYTKDMKQLVSYPLADLRTEFEIPYGVEVVCIVAFFDQYHIQKVYIPSTVTVIGSTAFNSATQLHDFYFYGNAPQLGSNSMCVAGSSWINIWHLEGAEGFDGNTAWDVYITGYGLAFDTFEDDGRYPIVPTYVLGDANDDGEVGLTDALVILRSLAGWTVTINEEAADVNDDASVGLQDALLILRHLAGWSVPQLAE